MNKTPWKPGDNKAKTAPGNLNAAKQQLAQGKQMKADAKVMGARMQKNAPNLPGFANAANQQKLAGAMGAAKSTIANAKAGIKANTPKGPTIGANRTPK
jgi:hypothetical protein